MDHKTYAAVTGLIFGAIAVMHALRLFYGWDAFVGETDIPVAASYIGVVVAGFLAYQAYRLSRRG